MFVFDGPSRTIELLPGVATFEVVDLYSRWKEWVALSDNAKFLPAFANSVGGDALGGGASLGQYFFIQNGWTIKPQESNHTLTVAGNLFPIPETAPTFKITDGNFNVQIVQQVSSLTQQVSTSGSTITANQIADAVWDEPLGDHNTAGSTGKELNDARINAQNAFAVSAS